MSEPSKAAEDEREREITRLCRLRKQKLEERAKLKALAATGDPIARIALATKLRKGRTLGYPPLADHQRRSLELQASCGSLVAKDILAKSPPPDA